MNEKREDIAQPSNCPTQAKSMLEWPTAGITGTTKVVPSRGLSESGLFSKLPVVCGEAALHAIALNTIFRALHFFVAGFPQPYAVTVG